MGNVPTLVAEYTAKEVPFGNAGDKLWRVAPAGVFKFKIIKWLPVGKYQSAQREFWYWIREDDKEWINFMQTDIDEVSRIMKVKFVQEDMRLQRLATDRLLEQRLMDKTFWEKWGNTIMTVVLFLVIAVAIVIIFYMFSKLIDKMQPMVGMLTESLKIVQKACPIYYNETINGGGASGLIPAS